jgi:hypothetical protein
MLRCWARRIDEESAASSAPSIPIGSRGPCSEGGGPAADRCGAAAHRRGLGPRGRRRAVQVPAGFERATLRAVLEVLRESQALDDRRQLATQRDVGCLLVTCALTAILQSSALLTSSVEPCRSSLMGLRSSKRLTHIPHIPLASGRGVFLLRPPRPATAPRGTLLR